MPRFNPMSVFCPKYAAAPPTGPELEQLIDMPEEQPSGVLPPDEDYLPQLPPPGSAGGGVLPPPPLGINPGAPKQPAIPPVAPVVAPPGGGPPGGGQPGGGPPGGGPRPSAGNWYSGLKNKLGIGDVGMAGLGIGTGALGAYGVSKLLGGKKKKKERPEEKEASVLGIQLGALAARHEYGY